MRHEATGVRMNNAASMLDEKGKSRIKERTIKEVIDSVGAWRQLYCGINKNGKVIKMSLEDAALKVGISKKSLDDYLMQLRSAKKFGFDFDVHKYDKVGVLRSFVRKKKEEERKRISKNNQADSGSGNAKGANAKQQQHAEEDGKVNGGGIGGANTTKFARKYRKSDFKPKASKLETASNLF